MVWLQGRLRVPSRQYHWIYCMRLRTDAGGPIASAAGTLESSGFGWIYRGSRPRPPRPISALRRNERTKRGRRLRPDPRTPHESTGLQCFGAKVQWCGGFGRHIIPQSRRGRGNQHLRMPAEPTARAWRNQHLRVQAETCAPSMQRDPRLRAGEEEHAPRGRKPNLRDRRRPEQPAPGKTNAFGLRLEPEQPVQADIRAFGHGRKPARRASGNRRPRTTAETGTPAWKETNVFGRRRKPMHRSKRNPRLRAKAEP